MTMGVNMENNNLRDDTTIAYGKNAVTQLLKSGGDVDTVYIQDSMNDATAGYYTALAKAAGAVVKRVHITKLNNMCGCDTHQGVAAYASSVEYLSLDELMAQSRERANPPFYVLCDGIEDPHNLGAIIRSAYLCGVHGVIIPKRGGVSVTPVVLKSSAGAAARMPMARVANIGEAVRRLKEANVFVYCADMQGEALERTNLSGAVALVVGSEGEGVSRLVKTLCDGAVALAMQSSLDGIDSYNVSVASGIILYDIMRQRAK